MDPITQIIQGKHGAPAMTAGELAMKWEMGLIPKHDLMTHYGITEKQIFEFSKAIKERKKDVYADLPPWPYEEGTYGSEGCAG